MSNPAGLEHVALRNDWYRDRYGSVLRVLAVISLALVASLALNVLQFFSQPEPKYFAVGEGGVIKMEPVDRALLSNDALAQWAGDTARRAYSLDFVHYDEDLSALRDRFEPKAFNAFLSEMEKTNLAAIKEQRLIFDAIADPAIIVKAGVAPNGHYLWHVEVPLTVTAHYGGDKQREQRLRVVLEIMRVDNRFRPESGVVVTKFLTSLS